MKTTTTVMNFALTFKDFYSQILAIRGRCIERLYTVKVKFMQNSTTQSQMLAKNIHKNFCKQQNFARILTTAATKTNIKKKFAKIIEFHYL